MALTNQDKGTFPGDQLQERVMADLYGWDGTQWVRITTGGGGGIVIDPTPNRATFACNQKIVPVPGTAQNLQAQAIPNGFSVVVKALPGNNDLVYVGNTALVAQDHTQSFPLDASKGEFLRLYVTDVDAIWVDAITANDGVAWIVEV